ncbi:MAG TPA: hypothetical protein VFL95_07415 [Gemmatimonadales bacterium]|nr:hypothetical protein [Gemmatimonadales bacterium]
MTVEQSPRELADLHLTWTPAFLRGGRMAIDLSHTGRYAEDPANTHWYGGHQLVGVQASWFVLPQVSVFGRVTNLFDRRYAALASYDPFQQTQYNPGSPRSIYAGVHYAWSH